MLIAIIALLAIVAGVSIGINLTFFTKLKDLASKFEVILDSLDKANKHVSKLRVGNNHLTKSLHERDRTIANLSDTVEVLMETIPELTSIPRSARSREFAKDAKSLTVYFQQEESENTDTMVMDHLLNDKAVSLKTLASRMEFDPSDFDTIEPDLQAVVYSEMDRQIRANRPHNQNPFSKIPGPAPEPSFYFDKPKKTDNVLEEQMNSYIKWENEQDDFPKQGEPRIGTALHEMAVELRGKDFDGETTMIFPKLEPLSIEQKES